jgi:hypothetical protein
MMFPVSDAKGNHRSRTPRENRGVLVNLPSTRPQHSSPRRAAARRRAARAGADPSAPSQTAVLGASAVGSPGAKPAVGPRKPTTARAASPKRARSAAKSSRGSAPRRDAAPRQGFESDSETATGSVQPPGGAEFVASAVELVGELAKVGLSTGERLFKDAFSRLPRS